MSAILYRGVAAAGARATRVLGRRLISLKSEGPWTFKDDMSVAHARELDAALTGYLPVNRERAAGEPTTPGSHLVYFNHAYPESELSSDGYDNSQAPVGHFPNRRWYGGSVQFNINTELVLGEPAVCTETLAEVRTSHGDERVNVTIERKIANENDPENWAIRERRSMFYFGDDPSLIDRQFKRHFAPKYTPKYELTMSPSRILLFRYSALNFNAHFIHYDADYSREMEQLPDILVQGPLMVTMLLWWFSEDVLAKSSRRIQLFTYRNLAPLCVNEDIRLCATPITQDSMEVWIENSKGSVVLSGTMVVA